MPKKPLQGTKAVPKQTPSVNTNDTLNPFLSDNDNLTQLESVGTGLYDMEYYSGSQAQVYIGDVFVDEVVEFQYTFAQNKVPIYGYASQLFDTVAPGTRIVQGSFSINFKEAGYLWLVLLRYKSFMKNVDNVLKRYGKFKLDGKSPTVFDIAGQLAPRGAAQSQFGGTNVPFARFFDNGKNIDFISRGTIERIVSGTATKQERFKFYQDLTGFATVNTPNAQDKVFEDIVEAFEDTVWLEKGADLDQLTRSVDDNFFDDFDMYVIFGDMSNPGANHTVRRIRNVHLLSTSQAISPTGEPLQESYSFLAKTVI